MRKWWRWLISPRRSFLDWLAERQAAREKELAEQERRLNEIADAAEAASEQAERETLERELAKLTPTRHALGSDRFGTPLLLAAEVDLDRLEAQAVTAYGNTAHLEMTLQATFCGEAAELLDMQGVGHSRGVGTALLQFTERVLYESGARHVRATLRYTDEEHLARLLHFFEKNGYRLAQEGEAPVIEKALQP